MSSPEFLYIQPWYEHRKWEAFPISDLHIMLPRWRHMLRLAWISPCSSRATMMLLFPM